MANNPLESKIGEPYYLFFDTETTGVPQNYKAPTSDTDNWPRLVQLGWIVADKEGNTIRKGNKIVFPDGFTIPIEASRVHGISTEKARSIGEPLSQVLQEFDKDLSQAKVVVGHNISFDIHIVGAEYYRLTSNDPVSRKRSICTMGAGTDFCKIPGRYGYKWPKLQELFVKLFGHEFEDAHDATADIEATKQCFFEMKRRGLI